MKKIILYIIAIVSLNSFSQENKEAQNLKALNKANDLVYRGNELISNDDYVAAEMAYREAISEAPSEVIGSYNLGTSYYKNGNFDEALYRLQQVAKDATSKPEKHKAFHNIGNILMKNKKCKEAVEAYKNALRNNPTDDESRYNLALAKECAKDQEDQNQDDNKDQDQDKEDENKENEDKKDQDEGDKKEDNQDKGDQDKKEGEDEKDDEGKPKDDKEDEGKPDQEGDNKEKEQPKPQPKPGQMSPQQIKNLLEAMNNQEEKVQEKINAEKQKGAKVQTEKDW